ncbi:MAG: bifunctional methylenetetrahydrofolate dehydrogenase/methenyltetrahydrofolate cyclohydrolase FolD [Oscillospiraceae bacterium]|jgi:methylenetetrahydrofolate dehydrogenase (NADP+)/methenyltetrahydrofolate cyclohydrolase|nr:bifunctional methylenetetrahydrofolate dehydrogenase/methenyltetrahydrofolate cyclohydrolase FolD [Oscillospiraceae bacterium]
MTLLDGKATAKKHKARIAEETFALKAKGITPGLAVVIVGGDPASRQYVDNKKKDCAQCGIYSEEHALPGDCDQAHLLALLDGLNRRADIHGILVQLPLPKHLDEKRVLLAIDPAKDVDAFHPFNVGRIMIGDYDFAPCTPAGVMALLDEYDIPVEGKTCVVVGRSNIVGKPQAMLLLHRHGTVTLCHSRTRDLGALTRTADILVAAVGREGLITADMVKEGAAVVDVAMNRSAEGKWVGDVRFDEVAGKAAYLTPVPGGVGPMTRVMLLWNTLKAAKQRADQ